VAVGITVGIGIIELTGAATQNFASVAGTATTGLHAGIHGRTNKDVRQVLAALRENTKFKDAGPSMDAAIIFAKTPRLGRAAGPALWFLPRSS
jgi:hypothetical protein